MSALLRRAAQRLASGSFASFRRGFSSTVKGGEQAEPLFSRTSVVGGADFTAGRLAPAAVAGALILAVLELKHLYRDQARAPGLSPCVPPEEKERGR